MKKLVPKGANCFMLRLLNVFLQDRSFAERVSASLSRKFIMEIVIPQGSAFSPIIFGVIIDDLPWKITSQPALFKDGIPIQSEGLCISDLLRSVQTFLNMFLRKFIRILSRMSWCRFPSKISQMFYRIQVLCVDGGSNLSVLVLKVTKFFGNIILLSWKSFLTKVMLNRFLA